VRWRPSPGIKKHCAALTDRDGFIPAPYLARAKWVYVKDVRKVGDQELLPLLTRSYEIIRDKLPKSKRP